MPSVSVIIPAFSTNAEMAGGLETLKKQAAQVKEIIIVDDGSDPPLIIPSWARGIRIDREPEWKNPATALNLGIKEARGTEIIICQAGLYLPPGTIRAMLGSKRAGNPLCVVTGRRIEVTDPTRFVAPSNPALITDLAFSMLNRQRFLGKSVV